MQGVCSAPRSQPLRRRGRSSCTWPARVAAAPAGPPEASPAPTWLPHCADVSMSSLRARAGTLAPGATSSAGRVWAGSTSGAITKSNPHSRSDCGGGRGCGHEALAERPGTWSCLRRRCCTRQTHAPRSSLPAPCFHPRDHPSSHGAPASPRRHRGQRGRRRPRSARRRSRCACPAASRRLLAAAPTRWSRRGGRRAPRRALRRAALRRLSAPAAGGRAPAAPRGGQQGAAGAEPRGGLSPLPTRWCNRSLGRERADTTSRDLEQGPLSLWRGANERRGDAECAWRASAPSQTAAPRRHPLRPPPARCTPNRAAPPPPDPCSPLPGRPPCPGSKKLQFTWPEGRARPLQAGPRRGRNSAAAGQSPAAAGAHACSSSSSLSSALSCSCGVSGRGGGGAGGGGGGRGGVIGTRSGSRLARSRGPPAAWRAPPHGPAPAPS
jgi:hypothetical protein